MIKPDFFSPGQPLDEVAEAIWDVDFDNAITARALTIKVLPTTSPVLVIHYRAAMRTEHRSEYRRAANGMQTKSMTLRPSGPVGAVLVRLKAEEASRVLGCDLADITNASIELSDIFGNREASLLAESLAAAKGARERVARMRRFLLNRMEARRIDPVARGAILALKRDPAITMNELVSHLGVGERNLQRRFKKQIGISPKQFARVARIQSVVAMRLKGSDWANVAYELGYNDQAHLINDFRSLVGAPPEAFFRSTTGAGYRHWNARLAASDFYNTFLI